MSSFNTLFEQYREKLELYVPVVARVHGGTHPEFHEVKHHFDQIVEKVKSKENDLQSDFVALRAITNQYLVPDDVCETYEAVYQMLAQLDEALGL